MRIWSKDVRMPLSVSIDLAQKMNELLREMKASNKTWEQSELASSQNYINFCDTTCELQRVSLVSLGRQDKIAFFLNILQIMQIHCLIRVRSNLIRTPPQNGGWASRITGLM